MTRWFVDTRGGAVRAVALALFAASIAPAAADEPRAAEPDATEWLPGFVTPFRTATLGVERLGRVAKLPVEEGEMVAAGDLLVGLADDVQRARAETARLKAESTLEIELARVRMEYADHELERTSSLRSDSLASAKELADARSAAESRRIEYQLALRDHEQARLDWALQQRLLDQYSIRAPFDGYVSKRLKQLGEATEEGEGVITLVQLDPLVVLLDCNLTFAHRIHEGDRLTVRPADSQWDPREGTVTFVGAAADAASQMIRVKLRVPNTDGEWLGGMKVYVRAGGGAEAGGMPQARKAAAPAAVARIENQQK